MMNLPGLRVNFLVIRSGQTPLLVPHLSWEGTGGQQNRMAAAGHDLRAPWPCTKTDQQDALRMRELEGLPEDERAVFELVAAVESELAFRGTRKHISSDAGGTGERMKKQPLRRIAVVNTSQ